MSVDLSLSFTVGQDTRLFEGRGVSEGSRWESCAGKFPVEGRSGAAMLACASIGRWVLILELGLFRHGSGPMRCSFHATGLDESLALMG